MITSYEEPWPHGMIPRRFHKLISTTMEREIPASPEGAPDTAARETRSITQFLDLELRSALTEQIYLQVPKKLISNAEQLASEFREQFAELLSARTTGARLNSSQMSHLESVIAGATQFSGNTNSGIVKLSWNRSEILAAATYLNSLG